jgi:glycosyltransferase involved in cell wall biosynthesis
MTDDIPTFSVIMPSYNHEKYINYAISSVLAQSLASLELIIVDGFSTDSSRKIIQSWIERDPRVKGIFQAKNEGIARGVNDGLKNAKGKYIALTASDDMFKPYAFERVAKLLNEYDVVVIDAECISSSNKVISLYFSQLYKKPTTDNIFSELIKGNFICTGFFKRSILMENDQHYYNENFKYLSDWLFWLELARYHSVIYVNEPLYYYRLHSSSSHLNSDIGFDALRAYDYVLEKYGDVLDLKSKEALLNNKAFINQNYCNPSIIGKIKHQVADQVYRNIFLVKILLMIKTLSGHKL